MPTGITQAQDYEGKDDFFYKPRIVDGHVTDEVLALKITIH